MNAPKALLALLAALGLAAAAPLWSHQGHELTAQVAATLLSGEAAAELERVLNGTTLAEAATWPDRVKYSEGWAWTKPLHFADAGEWACGFNEATDCPNGACVVGAIRNYTRRLESPEVTGEQRREAVMFLVHLVGDAHQPMHEGFRRDYGGNTVYGTFFGVKASLHHIWDRSLIEHRMATSFGNDQDAYGRHLAAALLPGGNFSAQTSAWAACPDSAPAPWLCPAKWAGESAALACEHGYKDSAERPIAGGFELGQAYYDFNHMIVDEQLAKGGFRLAAILNRVLRARA
jgi:nuclease S1